MSARHFGLAVVALAMGGFAIGTTEFVTMGLLPQIARGVDVSIPTGGTSSRPTPSASSSGAPVLAFLGARLPRRALLVALMVAFAVGNAASALATSYGALMLARFAAGLPHGAYFGVASLLAASMASPARKGRAVAAVMLGLSVANVVGVRPRRGSDRTSAGGPPSGASPSSAWSPCRWCWRSCPSCPGDGEASGRRELGAFSCRRSG